METMSALNNMHPVMNISGKLTATETPNKAYSKTPELEQLLLQEGLSGLSDLLLELMNSTGKKSFLVFRNNKYVNILTEDIALFYIKYESPVIMCFNKEEYFVNLSLKEIQSLLPGKKFFRLNKQFLVNFHAIKEVEHYFARKLLVNTVVPFKEKLLVPREKVTEFLHWLDNR